MTNPHSSSNNFNSCNSSGKKINYWSTSNNPPDYQHAFIKHYHNKSFEEYCIKLQRGRSDLTNKEKYENQKQKFFNENKNDKIKLNIMKKIFNITSNYL